MATVETAHRIAELLDIDGSQPIAIHVVDVTPDGHATPLFAVGLDYGWCSTTIGNDFVKRIDAAALAIGLALGLPVETSEQENPGG